MKKKVLVQVMGAVLVAGLMAGCGGTDEGKNEESTKTESTAEVTEAAESEESESSADEDDAEAADAEQTEDNAEEADAEQVEDSTEEADAAQAEDGTEESDSEQAEDSTEESVAAQTEDSTETADAGTGSADSDLGTVISAAGWNITVEDMELNTSLENVSVALGYTGVETNDYKKEADAGKTFCLLKMKIEKDGSKENFDWANLKLTDSEGNEYTRMEDDFISELGMTRMAGTTLNFGSNEGWIAFEINDGAEGLELNYAFEAEEYHCAL